MRRTLLIVAAIVVVIAVEVVWLAPATLVGRQLEQASAGALRLVECEGTIWHARGMLVAAPNSLIQDCFSVLKPGGLILFLNHDVASFPARILGESSPIFDIEHTYLYSLKTLRKLVIKYNFEVIEAGSAFNTYSLRYLVHLTPFPKFMKGTLLTFLSNSRIGDLKFEVPLGNLYMIAQKRLNT